MAATRYETHSMPNPMLPFIYHSRFEVTHRNKYPNWHENIELLQCIEGRGYVLCGAERIPLTPDSLVIVNADTLHSIGTDSRVVYRCLIIDNSFFAANGVPIRSLYFQSLITDPQIRARFDRIAQAYGQLDQEDFRSVLDVRAQVLNLVSALCRDHTVQKPEDPSNEHVKRAVIYLRQHLTEPLSLDTLSEAVGISKFHLAHLFKLYTGKTVVQTLNLIRCTEAQRLIENGASVSAAAFSCGFENLSYFTRTFKKYMGTLPSKHVEK